MGTFVQAFTELGTGKKIMKILLVIALFGVAVQAEADPGFVYTVGHPHAYGVGYPHAYGVPLVYTHPVAYANNVCTNEGGAVVPCAAGVAPGSGIYNFADAPAGLLPVVGAAPVAAVAAADAVVSVEKREAEAEAEADPEAEAAADAWYSYYGRPSYYGGYYGYGGYSRGYYGLPYGYGYYAHGGRPYSYGWTDGPNNGVGPYVYGK